MYVDKDNNNRKITEIIAQKVSFLEKAASEDSDYGDSYKKGEVHDEEFTSTTTDDDVPF